MIYFFVFTTFWIYNFVTIFIALIIIIIVRTIIVIIIIIIFIDFLTYSMLSNFSFFTRSLYFNLFIPLFFLSTCSKQKQSTIFENFTFAVSLSLIFCFFPSFFFSSLPAPPPLFFFFFPLFFLFSCRVAVSILWLCYMLSAALVCFV